MPVTRQFVVQWDHFTETGRQACPTWNHGSNNSIYYCSFVPEVYIVISFWTAAVMPPRTNLYEVWFVMTRP